MTTGTTATMTAALALALTAVMGASAQDQVKDPTVRDRLPAISQECIFERSLHDWRALDRYNLIVWAPSRRHPYHVELDFPCDQLPWVDTIGFTNRPGDGRICGFGGDSIVVGRSFTERCPIGAIHRITPEQAQALIATFRQAREQRAAQAGGD
ncbi:MAG: hypothetical protein IT495_04830 [Gammaproteobacteria bacterium]|nr:hypothetical protein [Gammaproteobacteria bacterium]